MDTFARPPKRSYVKNIQSSETASTFQDWSSSVEMLVSSSQAWIMEYPASLRLKGLDVGRALYPISAKKTAHLPAEFLGLHKYVPNTETVSLLIGRSGSRHHRHHRHGARESVRHPLSLAIPNRHPFPSSRGSGQQCRHQNALHMLFREASRNQVLRDYSSCHQLLK